MLMILTSVFGFLAPFLPEVLKFFNRKADNAHELAVLEMRLKAGAAEHTWRMEEITAQADIAEAVELHKPQQSFGMQMLDAAHGLNYSQWVMIPAFWAFAFLDLVSGMVRPVITYTAFSGYLAYKWAYFTTLTGPRFQAGAFDAMTQIWGEQDWAVLTLVLSFWFGSRASKATFGGSAQSAKSSG